MTRKEFKKSVWIAVVAIMRRTGIRLNDVKVDHRHETIACGKFFAQGEDASTMLSEYPQDINERVWTMFYLDSAGAI